MKTAAVLAAAAGGRHRGGRRPRRGDRATAVDAEASVRAVRVRDGGVRRGLHTDLRRADLRALGRDGGDPLEDRAKAGINGCPSVAGDTLLVPAGAPHRDFAEPVPQLIAYRLSSSNRMDGVEQALNATFERAAPTAARLAANVATVVEGKDEQIRLILAALACKGHVLLEDVPGHREDGARPSARRLDRRRDRLAHPVHARSPADGHHRALGLEPEHEGVRVQARPDLRQHPRRRRGQPGAAEGAVRPARGDGRAPGHGRRRHPRAARPVLRRRDREHDRAGGNLPAARGPARPLPDPHLPRLPDARRGARDRRRAAARASARRPQPGHRRRRAHRHLRRGRGDLHRPAAEAVGASSSSAGRAATTRSRSARPCAAALRSSAWRAPGRSSKGATT